jgi:hypothetical protein
MVRVRDLLRAFLMSLPGDDLSSSLYLALWILGQGVLASSQYPTGLLRAVDGQNLPAVSHHAHSFGFSHAVKFGALLQVLLAPNTLRIAESCFGKGVDISPS